MNYIGPFNRTGYGIAAVGYAMGMLDKLTAFQVIGQPDTDSKELFSPPYDRLISKFSSADPEKDTIIHWHINDLKNQLPSNLKGKKHLLTAIEVDSFSREDYNFVDNTFDKVIVPCVNNKDILSKYISTDRIIVAPHALKISETDKLSRWEPKPQDKLNEFWSKLLIDKEFDLILSAVGKFEKRKGYDELFNLLEHLSSKPESTLLITYLHNRFIPDGFPYHLFFDWEAIKTKSNLKLYRKDNAYIVLMPPAPSRKHVHNTASIANYFISLSKAEGWNLPLFEMASYGMPCIASNISPHTDYLNPKDFYAINMTDTESAFDPPWFTGTTSWPCISDIEKDLYQPFNTIISEKDSPRQPDIRGFTWQKSAEKIISSL